MDKLPLMPNDLMVLESSFITRELAEQAGLFRVSDLTGAEMIGKKPKAGTYYNGIGFPYFLPEQNFPREYRLRRDKGDIDQKSDGTIKEKGKYMTAPGGGNMLYFSPGCLTEYLTDTSLPIVITEGEKKTLALKRASQHGLTNSNKPKFLAIGLSGVWNFRGVIGKTQDATGNRRDVKGLIPDFNLLEIAGRKIIILYDANAKTNESVKAAERNLAKELTERGARVFIADCPDIKGCNGIDDILGKIEREDGTDKAIERLLKILEAAKPFKPEKISQSNQILQTAEGLDLFHTTDGKAFASIEVRGHLETHRLNSKMFRQYLSFQFYQAEGKVPSSQAIHDAIAALSGQARFAGETREIFVRLAAYEGKIYLDLCNEDWQIVEIDVQGYKVLESINAPVRFQRTKAMQELPIPTKNGDISKLKNFLNVDENNLILILAWLVNCFRPDYPFPIIMFSGEQGTAKSTASKVLRELVDPSLTPFRSAPRDERDLVIAATNAWICAFDNLSAVPNWLSDALCRISTGGGFSTRMLYENDEETIFSAKRPIILNGIGDIANRSDLLDRALIVKLEAIPKDKRKPERQFWSDFEKERRTIFSALISAVSIALQNIENITLPELPRMADFALWATAAEQGLGLEKDAFINAYTQNRADAHSIVLEDSILAEVLQEFCAANAVDNKYSYQNILLKDFLAELKETADSKNKERSKDKTFPKSPKGLRNQIERINPNLRETGIFITFHGRTGGNASKGASLSLDYDCNQTSLTSQTSQSLKNKVEINDVISDETKNGKMSNITNIINQGGNITIAKANGNNGLASKNDVSDESDVYLHHHSGNDENAEFIDMEI